MIAKELINKSAVDACSITHQWECWVCCTLAELLLVRDNNLCLKLQTSTHWIRLTREHARGKHWNVIYEQLQSLIGIYNLPLTSVSGGSLHPKIGTDGCAMERAGTWHHPQPHFTSVTSTALWVGLISQKNSPKRVWMGWCICQGSSGFTMRPWFCPCPGFYPWALLSEALPNFPPVDPFLFFIPFLPQSNCSQTPWLPRRQISV